MGIGLPGKPKIAVTLKQVSIFKLEHVSDLHRNLVPSDQLTPDQPDVGFYYLLSYCTRTQG